MRINFFVRHCENLLKKVPGRVGKIILDKFSGVLAKGISNILSLDATDKDNNDLDPEHISSLKYAQITQSTLKEHFNHRKRY
jgi:hypothetical protein